MEDLVASIKSNDGQIRNAAAIEFIDKISELRTALLESIMKPENRKNRGTLVYALQEISCRDLFIPLFSILVDSGFEVAMSVYQIFENQHFQLTTDEKKNAREIYSRYLSSLENSEFDFEDERKLRIEEVIEWYCGDVEMDREGSTEKELFSYCPVFLKHGGQVACYQIFQHLETQKFHVQSKDFITNRTETDFQNIRRLFELFSETSPGSRIQGFSTIAEAIQAFDQEFK